MDHCVYSAEHLGPMTISKNSPVAISRRRQACWSTLPVEGWELNPFLAQSLCPVENELSSEG